MIKLKYRYYNWRGYQRDYAKRMWYRTRSECCDAHLKMAGYDYDKKTKVPAYFRWTCERCADINCVPVTTYKYDLS